MGTMVIKGGVLLLKSSVFVLAGCLVSVMAHADEWNLDPLPTGKQGITLVAQAKKNPKPPLLKLKSNPGARAVQRLLVEVSSARPGNLRFTPGGKAGVVTLRGKNLNAVTGVQVLRNNAPARNVQARLPRRGSADSLRVEIRALKRAAAGDYTLRLMSGGKRIPLSANILGIRVVALSAAKKGVVPRATVHSGPGAGLSRAVQRITPPQVSSARPGNLRFTPGGKARVVTLRGQNLNALTGVQVLRNNAPAKNVQARLSSRGSPALRQVAIRALTQAAAGDYTLRLMSGGKRIPLAANILGIRVLALSKGSAVNKGRKASTTAQPPSLPQGAKLPKAKVPPDFGKSIRTVPGGVGLGKGLGEGNIGNRLPAGVASPRGAGGRTGGLGKGLPSGSSPGKFSESEKFQKSIGPRAGRHSTVQSQDADDHTGDKESDLSDEEWAILFSGDIGPENDPPDDSSTTQHSGDVGDSPIEGEGDDGEWYPESDPGHEDAGDEMTFTEEEGEEDYEKAKKEKEEAEKAAAEAVEKANEAAKKAKEEADKKCAQAGANCSDSERSVAGDDSDPDPGKVDPRWLDPSRLGKAKQPKGPLGDTIRSAPGEEPDGEGGQPAADFVPSPVSVNPGPEQVDLPGGAVEDLNQQIIEKATQPGGGAPIGDTIRIIDD